MKIGVISDSHGSMEFLEKAVKNLGEVDIYIHLGDFIKDAKVFFENTDKTYVAIKGNCDIGDGEEEVVLDLNEKKFLITHGHKYNINYGYNNIYYRALESEADVVLFGHTHSPVSIWYKSILFFNPGSVAYPRKASKASYGIIEIIDGEIYPDIYEL